MDEDNDKCHGVDKGHTTIARRKQIFRFGLLLTILCALYWGLLSKSGKPFMYISRNTYTHDDAKHKWNKITTGRRADWLDEEEVPEFCKSIFKNPQPLNKTCHRNAATLECRNFNNEVQMFSQFHQDHFLYTQHFRFLRRSGVYVDIASNDPIVISNTYFFDRCLGWKGVCVEGNPEYFERLYRLRSCHLVPTCVGNRDGEMVSFALNRGGGGVMGDSYKSKNRVAKENITMISERCTTMKLALERESIEEVDYLSLDVEGHEGHVLRGFDLDRVKINVMTIEVTGTALKEIEEILIPKGYKRHFPDSKTVGGAPGLLKEDAIFLHESVVWGSPV